MTFWAAALLFVLLGFGSAERRRRDRNARAVPIRIHVNGTRGKSAVTRLIAAALREAGITTLAKTTGTEARLILPDGTDEPVRRRSSPSIREQLWVLRRAARLGAQAVVVECMAIDPDLQRVSEHEMLRSTLGVITNARHDHGDVMGTTIDQVATALANTVPRGGVTVIGESAGARVIEHMAAENGSHVIRAWEAPIAPAHAGEPDWMCANRSVAIAVTRQLGIDDVVAMRGMGRARPDPGAAATCVVRAGTRELSLIDATAANDPDSLRSILGRRDAPYLFVFRHRADRPFRLRQFADAAPWDRAGDVVWLTGDRPDWITWRCLRRGLSPTRASVVSTGRLAGAIGRLPETDPDISTVVCCGNTRGFSRELLRTAVEGA